MRYGIDKYLKVSIKLTCTNNYECLIKNAIENFHIDNLPCFKKLEYLSNLLPLVGLCHEEICRLILSVGLK